MKTKSSFVRSDCTVELYTITFVYLYVTLIIYPRNLEGTAVTAEKTATLVQLEGTVLAESIRLE